jgi:hypothetical protein
MRKIRNNNKRSRFSILFPILTIIGIGIISVLISGYENSWTFNWSGIQNNIRDSISVYEYQSISSGIGGNGRAMPEEIESRLWKMQRNQNF